MHLAPLEQVIWGSNILLLNKSFIFIKGLYTILFPIIINDNLNNCIVAGNVKF